MAPTWKTGGRAPDFEYTQPGGASARFADLWAEGPVLFVWARHSGSPFFQEALAQLRANRRKLAERGVELALVVQTRPEELRALCGAELR